MSELKETIDDVYKNLLNEPIVQEFLNLKTQIENNDEILELDKSMREHQKNMVKFAADEEKAANERALYLIDKDLLENHPLVKNYNLLKEEIEDLLQQMKEIIS